MYHACSVALVLFSVVVVAEVAELLVVDVAAGTAHPAPIKRALVNNNGAATKSRTLKISAKIIDPRRPLSRPF